jgi:hypothetical protein
VFRRNDNMTTTFFIAPFPPTEWRTEYSKAGSSTVLPRIEPNMYASKLVEQWPGAVIRTRKSSDLGAYALQWVLPVDRPGFAGFSGQLLDNQSVVSFDSGPKEIFLEFILWHISTNLAGCRLFLFSSTGFDYMELTKSTAASDIEVFTGFID